MTTDHAPFSPCKPGTHIQSLLSSPVLTEPVLAQASLGGEDLGVGVELLP